MCLLTCLKCITVESFISKKYLAKENTYYGETYIYNPEDTYEEKYVIPIKYDTLLECAYIPHEEYVKCMSKDTDCGIDKEKIDLIQKIMEYLENNKLSIHRYCNFLSRKQRVEINS